MYRQQSQAESVSCKCGYMGIHLKTKGERTKAPKRTSEIVHNFVTEGKPECIFSLRFSIWLVSHKSAGLTLNNQCLLDTPQVVNRGTAGYFTQFYCVEMYCFNLTHLKQGNLLRVSRWRRLWTLSWLCVCDNTKSDLSTSRIEIL